MLLIGYPDILPSEAKMKNRLSRILAGLTLFFSFFVGSAGGVEPNIQPTRYNVLVNIWDGTEWYILQEIYLQGLLPNLALVGAPKQLTDAVPCWGASCMWSVTKPQHAVMLTGKLADEHGVYSNWEYQLIPDGMTLYEVLESAVAGIKTAHISSKDDNFGLPTFGNIVGDVDIFYAGPKDPSPIAKVCAGLLREWQEDRFFAVCHFREPDHTGHAYGVYSPEYENAILQNDIYLGQLLQAVPPDTYIYVVSDHGFGGIGPDNNHVFSPNAFLVTNDPEMSGWGYRMDELFEFWKLKFLRK